MTIRRLNDPFVTFSAHITIGRFSKSESMDPLAEELLLLLTTGLPFVTHARNQLKMNGKWA